ncbi:T9SS type A sorting domain-containing protein [Hymenobacter koreensis]|uniref:T9SS type A sorting domain-containing protein n=1 Tax=Hymenobacter koreensis TaxID=1084523 RepID=A0ABP8J1H8_9BACT
MPLSTLLSRLTCLLAAAGLSFAVQAQTAPSWLGATALGSGPNFTGAAVVDAAGNTYEVSAFNAPTLSLGGTTLTNEGSNNSTDAILAKYTPAGTLAWVRQIGSAGSESALGVALDAAGNAYVVGDFGGNIDLGNGVQLNTGSATNARRFFVARYSPQGTATWAQQSTTSAVGGGVGVDAAGNVWVGGYYSTSLTIGSASISSTSPGRPGTFLARFAASTGALQSLYKAFEYGPASGSAAYYYPTLAVAPSGETYLINDFNQPAVFSGTSLTSRGGMDVLVAKYSAQGTFEWAQQLGGPGDERGRAGTCDATGHLYLAGFFAGSAAAGTTPLTSAGDVDGVLLKYSPQGSLQWAQTSGGPGPDALGYVALDAAGNPYVVGNFSGTARFGTATLTSAGDRDMSVAAYTAQGQLRWLQQAGGPGFDSGSYLGLDARGDVFVRGAFAGTCAFGPINLASALPREVFVARLGNSALATKPSSPTALAFYPNPAHAELHLPALPAGTRLHVLDALGRTVRETQVTGAAPVSVRGLRPGLYTLRAIDAQGRSYTGRVRVE